MSHARHSQAGRNKRHHPTPFHRNDYKYGYESLNYREQ
jgi:hypothetical protein